jgi:hypothetical protein
MYPVFASYTVVFAPQLREKHGKISVRVVEKCPDIPVAAVQCTFTHKQYTQQNVTFIRPSCCCHQLGGKSSGVYCI